MVCFRLLKTKKHLKRLPRDWRRITWMWMSWICAKAEIIKWISSRNSYRLWAQEGNRISSMCQVDFLIWIIHCFLHRFWTVFRMMKQVQLLQVTLRHQHKVAVNLCAIHSMNMVVLIPPKIQNWLKLWNSLSRKKSVDSSKKRDKQIKINNNSHKGK